MRIRKIAAALFIALGVAAVTAPGAAAATPAGAEGTCRTVLC